MPRVYELPTHLGVEDQLIFGLTVPQLLRLTVGAAIGYAVWDQLRWIPDDPRLVITVGLTLVGAIFAVIRPGGRALDQWLLAGVLFAALPRRLTWRRDAALLGRSSRDQTEWADLELRPDWPGFDMPSEDASTQFTTSLNVRDPSRWRES
jgi:hypothetical protein